MALLEVEEVSVRFGGIVALDDLSFAIEPGRICGLIGPNGAGKTTLFNVISRIYDPTWGMVRFEGDEPPRRLCLGHRGAGRGPHIPEPRVLPDDDHHRERHGRRHVSIEDELGHRRVPRRGGA